MFKAKQVDAAVTWEPDLSRRGRRRAATRRTSWSRPPRRPTSSPTRWCARQDVIDQAPETVRDFVHGWFDGIEMIKQDPAGAYAVVGKALKLDTDDRVRACSPA